MSDHTRAGGRGVVKMPNRREKGVYSVWLHHPSMTSSLLKPLIGHILDAARNQGLARQADLAHSLEFCPFPISPAML